MDNIDKTERFFKHRRNMLLLSSIFIFLVLSGGTIKHISILGSKLDFSNPGVPVKILFIALLYMLIKYFQFLAELNGTGIKSKIHTIVSQQVPNVTHQLAKKQGGASGFELSHYHIVGNERFFTFEVMQDASNLVEGKATKLIAKGTSDTYIMGLKELWPVYIKALFHVLIKTTWFAEYAMPLILAISGMYLYLFTDIHEIIWLSSKNG